MNAPNRKTLSWQKRPLPELLRLAWPIAVSMVSYATMTLVDTLFVGWISAGALAGVGIASTLFFAITCFPFGVFRGTNVLVSQAVGAKKPEEARRYQGVSLIAALLLGALALVLGEVGAVFMTDLTVTSSAATAGTTYLRIRMLTVPATMLFSALRQARYGFGDARRPMVASVSANALNVGMDWLFISGFGWGVAGAAWATSIAQVAEFALLAVLVPWKQLRTEAFGMRHLRALWRVGLPTGLQFSLEVGSFLILAALISKMGEAQMAAHQVALQVVHFAFLPAVAWAEASAVMVGQAVGAGRHELVKPVARLAAGCAMSYTGSFALFLVLAAPWLAGRFSDDAALIEVATNLLYVAATFQIFDGAYIVARAALRGTGDVRFPAVVGVVCAWAFTPPVTYLLGYHLELGAVGGWIGLSLDIAAGACILWYRLLRGGWQPAAERERRLRLRAEVVPA